jgi:lipopolysaccharide/colanic/teichoic acid biosynthesis glycosyltransferase
MPSSRPVRWLRLLGRGRQTLDLPGLLSASEFERLFQREKALADRQARTFSLVVIDPRGDEEHLARLCEVLRDRLRGGDAVGRLDSERLAVLLAGTDAKGAWTYADDLLRRLAEAEVSADCRVYADLPYQFQGQGKLPGGSLPGGVQPSSLSGASPRPLPPSGAGPQATSPAGQAGNGLESGREPQHPGQKRLEFPDGGDGAPGEAPGPRAAGSGPVESGSQAERGTSQEPEEPEGQDAPLRIQDHPLHRLEHTGAGAPIADGNTLRRLEREPAALAGNLVAFPERLSDMAAIRRDLGERPVYNLEEVLVAPTPFWKRAMDILGSGLALICLAPLLGLLALLVRLSSPGPIIFRQQRVGAGGRPFTFYKFRSMYVDAEARKAELMAQNEADGPVFKMKNDPRVTPIGRILRRYSLDELPQLWNVFRGDMSLVGPRPPTPNEVPGYQAWQRQRLRLKGGLTCTWQVSGRSDVSFEEWMRMDARYAKQRGLRTDIKLILETIKAIFTGRGAY